MSEKIIFGTTNRGKIKEVSAVCSKYSLQVLLPEDLQINVNIDESGESFRANAVLKVENLLNQITDPNILAMADDSGIEIPALNGEPGVHTRRWKGYTMTDEEIREYCLSRMAGLPYEQRHAVFKTVIAIGSINQEIKTYEGVLEGIIVETPNGPVSEGFPFGSLFYIPAYKTMLGELHLMDEIQKEKFPSHRILAITQALSDL